MARPMSAEGVRAALAWTLHRAAGYSSADPDAGSLGTLHQAVEKGHQVFLLDGLLLDQGRGDLVELRTVVGEDLQRLIVSLVDELADLGVDLEGDLVRVVGMGREVPP